MADPKHPRQRGSVDTAAALSTVNLSEFGLRREPPRQPADRQTSYESLFDYDTLFYDVFRSGDGEGIVCIGPPLLNCGPAFANAVFRLPGTGAPVAYEYHAPQLITQPSCRFYFRGSDCARAQSVRLDAAGRSVEIPICPSGRALFAGRRVITTLSKNNPLAWIGDWVEFNVRMHGADAVLIYDNGSTDYDLEDIRKLLASIDDLAVGLVVPWRFPYGPGTGPKKIQDSFYCQPGSLDHARRRYCAAARSVLNTDIDEFVVMSRGKSIFRQVENSKYAAIVFSGIWAETTKAQPPQLIRHTDFRYRQWKQVLQQQCRRFRRRKWARPFRQLLRTQLLRTKWVAVPGRCTDDMEWGVHDVYAASDEARAAQASWRRWRSNIVYRHFRQLTLGRNEQRKIIGRYSPFRLARDRGLIEAMAAAFPQRSKRPHTQTWRRLLRSFGADR